MARRQEISRATIYRYFPMRESASSYYFEHHGYTAFLRPASARQAWEAARTLPLHDYMFTQLPAAPDAERVPVIAGATA